MFEKAISYPATGEKAVGAFVIGTLLSLLGILIVPGLIVFGYLIRVLRQARDDETAEVPAYDEWGTLLVDGLKAAIVTIGYVVVPVLIGLFVVFAVFLSFTTVTVVETGDASSSDGVVVGDGVIVESEAATDGLGAFGAIALLVSVLLVFAAAVWSLAALYVLPAGLAHFAVTGRMASAFAVRRLWPVLTSGTYFVAWLLALAVSIAAGFVVGLVSLVPVLGVLLGVAVFYYATVVGFRLYGEGYARAVPVEDGPEPPAGQPAA